MMSIEKWALEKLVQLDGSRFEYKDQLKEHIYALGRLANRSPQESRELAEALWRSSAHVSPTVEAPFETPQKREFSVPCDQAS